MAGTQIEFDEATTDPVALAAMFDQLEKGIPAEAPEAKTEDDEAAKAAAEAAKTEEASKQSAEEKAKADAAAKASDEKEPDGVATKDGKHIIPYSVLQADRARATRAEQALQEAQAKLAEMEAAAKSGKSENGGATPPTQKADAGDLTDEELAVMKEDYPIQYKLHMATQAKLDALRSQSEKVGSSVQAVEAEHQRTADEMVQDAIDATPKLAHVMATDPKAFASAKNYDADLKADPDWAGKPLAERFAKVMELVEIKHGPITVPGQQQAATTPPAKTAEQLKAEAQAAAETAAKASKTAVPTSLSEFSAGEHAAESEIEALNSMTHVQLAAKFAGMSPDKLEAYLINPH